MEQGNQKQRKGEMLLHPNEVEIIESIRKRYRYGKIEVITRDGIPIAIEKTVERQSLNVTNRDGRI